MNIKSASQCQTGVVTGLLELSGYMCKGDPKGAMRAFDAVMQNVRRLNDLVFRSIWGGLL